MKVGHQYFFNVPNDFNIWPRSRTTESEGSQKNPKDEEGRMRGKGRLLGPDQLKWCAVQANVSGEWPTSPTEPCYKYVAAMLQPSKPHYSSGSCSWCKTAPGILPERQPPSSHSWSLLSLLGPATFNPIYQEDLNLSLERHLSFPTKSITENVLIRHCFLWVSSGIPLASLHSFCLQVRERRLFW